jgi:poly(hydroxyalkanoate) depolymerase family esterase
LTKILCRKRILKFIDENAAHRLTSLERSRISETIRRALASAGLDTGSGPMQGIADTIDHALSAAGLVQRSVSRDFPGMPIDTPTPRRGEFLEHTFSSAVGSRKYKVYTPTGCSTASSEPVPMIVMLHGCTQSPDDFAAGTRMNALADQHGFVVVYPAQPANANAQKCWNWFRSEDQARDSGEPALIAGITRQIARSHGVDDRRIFVAGMSAGAAMAVVLGATYPDLFTAVGAHSGLPYRAAHDLPSAFSAMHGIAAPDRATSKAIPTIVFHGDKDHTVAAGNAAEIAARASESHPSAPLRRQPTTDTAAGGRKYTRTDYFDESGRVQVEHWNVHGAGHAWSGGSAAGSFTDARGPDASREMIRFFYSVARAGSA